MFNKYFEVITDREKAEKFLDEPKYKKESGLPQPFFFVNYQDDKEAPVYKNLNRRGIKILLQRNPFSYIGTRAIIFRESFDYYIFNIIVHGHVLIHLDKIGLVSSNVVNNWWKNPEYGNILLCLERGYDNVWYLSESYDFSSDEWDYFLENAKSYQNETILDIKLEQIGE